MLGTPSLVHGTLAGILGCDESLTEAYSLGLVQIPVKLAAWLVTLSIAHEAANGGQPNGLKGKRYTGLME